MPICLDFVSQRGASCFLFSDQSMKWFVNFFIDQCIEARQFGTTSAVLAITSTAVVLKECIEKSLMEDTAEHVFKFARLLVAASHPTEAVAFRKAAADSLRLAGHVWLEMSGKDVELTRNLFQVILNLMQDEDKDVRTETALFLTTLLSTPEAEGRQPIDIMCCNYCLKGFADNITRWFNPFHLTPFVFELLKFSDGVGSSESKTECFYEPEAPNFYCEEGELVDFLISVANSLIKNIDKTAESDWANRVGINVNNLIAEAEKFLQNICTAAEGDGGFTFAESTELHSALLKLSAQLRIAHQCFPQCAGQLTEIHKRITGQFVAL